MKAIANSRPAGKRQAQSFTLVELLVVTSIIMILGGLILGGLSSSKERARTIYCLNGISQYGKAMAMYINENKDTFAPYSAFWSTVHPKRRQAYPEFIFGPAYDDYVGKVRDPKRSKILQCPSWPGMGPFFTAGTVYNNEGKTESGGYYMYSYNYNYTYIGHPDKVNMTNLRTVAKLSEIKKPSRTLLFGEPGYDALTKEIVGAVAMTAPWRDNGTSPGNKNAIHGGGTGHQYLRHMGERATNVCWVDGHAQTIYKNAGGFFTPQVKSPYCHNNFASAQANKYPAMVHIMEAGITDYALHGDDLYDLE